MKVIPLEDRVLVKILENEAKTPEGIIIPDTAKAKETTGKVIAVGEGVTEVKEGDVVLYGRHSGTRVEVETINYLLLRKADCFAILK